MPRKKEDMIVDAAVERALANLGGVLPPGAIESLRRSGRLALKLDPRAQEIIRMLKDRPSVQRSGILGAGDEEEDDGALSGGRER
jgi:hypothetical protein